MSRAEFVKMVADLHWDCEEVGDKEFHLGNDDMYDIYVDLIQTAREIVKEQNL